MVQPKAPSNRARFALRALVWMAGATAGCAAPGAAGGAADRSVLVIAPEVAVPVKAKSDVFRCDEGRPFQVGGRAYCGYEEPSSWQAAERRCADNGGHLMSLDTEATSEALRAALRSPLAAGRGVWIGLHEQRQGAWSWVTGEALGSASWEAGEPNNFGGSEECAEWLAAGGTWNDTRCELEQGYLCQASSAGGKLACSGKAFKLGHTAYCLHNEDPLAWEDARRSCEGTGGSLAVLRAPDDSRALREAMAARFNARQMWIGLTDHGREGAWGWVSRAKGDFTAWEDGEPNNYHGEDCGELHGDSWMWNDLDCRARLPSVCEGPLQ
jgi:hypothetical protein